jgi:hypothetical protein
LYCCLRYKQKSSGSRMAIGGAPLTSVCAVVMLTSRAFNVTQQHRTILRAVDTALLDSRHKGENDGAWGWRRCQAIERSAHSAFRWGRAVLQFPSFLCLSQESSRLASASRRCDVSGCGDYPSPSATSDRLRLSRSCYRLRATSRSGLRSLKSISSISGLRPPLRSPQGER